MKKIVLAVLAGTVAMPALAAPGDTATTQGTATAQVVAPIAITHNAGAALSFGTMTAGNGGLVRVDAAGAGTVSGEVRLVAGGTTSADAFTVTGDANRAFSITTGNGTVTAGANSMAFTTTAAASGTLNASGTTSFRVGGTLTVASNQAAGSYTGSYNATVTYN